MMEYEIRDFTSLFSPVFVHYDKWEWQKSAWKLDFIRYFEENYTMVLMVFEDFGKLHFYPHTQNKK